jgi:tetratricopeptide (TPR) repeat protein
MLLGLCELAGQSRHLIHILRLPVFLLQRQKFLSQLGAPFWISLQLVVSFRQDEQRGPVVKEAATAWLQIDDPKKALDAARKSLASAPETRSDLLAYFWRRGLADVFLKAGDAPAAVAQYEEALKKTTIEGYRKDCEKLLAEAKSKSKT